MVARGTIEAEAEVAVEVDQMNSVEIRELDLSFGAVKVLKGLNLEIQQGEFLVLLGLHRSSKTSQWMRVTGRAQHADEGIADQGHEPRYQRVRRRGQLLRREDHEHDLAYGGAR